MPDTNRCVGAIGGPKKLVSEASKMHPLWIPDKTQNKNEDTSQPMRGEALGAVVITICLGLGILYLLGYLLR